MTDGIKGHYSLVNQLVRSATSIDAKIWKTQHFGVTGCDYPNIVDCFSPGLPQIISNSTGILD